MIKDGAVVGFERTREINSVNGYEYNALNWFRGELGSNEIRPLWLSSDYEYGRTQTIRKQCFAGLRRWNWAAGQFWFAFEALYGPVGAHGCSLWRTQPPSQVNLDASPLARDFCRSDWNEESGELTVSAPFTSHAYTAKEAVERLSMLAPLRRDLRALDRRKKVIGDLTFRHGEDGFDFIPHNAHHWTLFMTVEHTMQIWDCRTERPQSENRDSISNHWKLTSEFWVPWQGPYFIVKVAPADANHFRREYVLIRDCGEVYELNAYQEDGEWHVRQVFEPPRLKTYQERGTWHGEQLLKPIDYLVAILYLEPNEAVYGFGPGFYVRLDAPVLALEKKPCRDVTQGKAIWTDDDGKPHELGEPFRTVWQCAQVLKEEGVLSDPDSVVDDEQSEEE